MAAESIYLDHNATTPLLPAAAEAMQRAWGTSFANPASQHGPGRAARRRLEADRERTLQLLGGEPTGRHPDRLVFTSGGTEANTLALRGILAANGRSQLVVSAIEHPSVAATAQRLAAEGVTVHTIGVSGAGVVSVAELAELLEAHGDRIGLVSVMAASNETGVLQPIAELAELCRAAGVPLHTDAVQAVGKQPCGFRELGVSAMTFTAHKFHGPLGIGGLVLVPGVEATPLLAGGFQQAGLRPGTESAPLAAGLVVALEAAVEEMPARRERLRRLRDRLEQRLIASWPDADVIGSSSPRLEHTSCLAFPGVDRQALVMAYDLAGVACSTGSACASGSSKPSPTLVAMGLPERLVGSAVRFAVGAMTTEEQLEEAIQRIEAVNARLLLSAAATSTLSTP